jgi:hypothetical protein
VNVYVGRATAEEIYWDEVQAAHDDERCVDDCPICRENNEGCAKDRERCPRCGSADIEARYYDYDIDPETGYRDAGERCHCNACGVEGELG